jgi:hypothetical protein
MAHHQAAGNRGGRPRTTRGQAGATLPPPPDFAVVNAAALRRLQDILERWLPDGQRRGTEWVARNPTRADRRPGSFAVNLRTGRWADFATGDKGGDPVSLAAYLFHLSQGEAARRLAGMLGLEGSR